MENKFPSNLLWLRKNAGLNQHQMADILGKKKSIIGPYEKGVVEPDLTTILRISNHFGISISDLVGKDLSEKGYRPQENTPGNPKGNLKGNLIGKAAKNESRHAHPNAHPNAHLIHAQANAQVTTQVIDTSGHRLVPIVDIRAAAGEGYINPETVEENDVFRLPPRLVKGKNPLCIRIKGPSMAPTLNDGGYVIITLLDHSEWLNMRDKFIYVIIDTEGKAYIKRVRNRFSGENGGFIVLTSDNPDKQSHPNFNLMPSEIAFIWNVEMYFTHKMPNIHDQYYTRLSNLEDQFLEVQDLVKKLEARLK